MFKKLLVPLDRSPLAEQAIGQAAAIARASGAGLDLVLVHQPFPFDGFSDAPWSAQAWHEERRYLELVADEVSSGSSVSATHAILRGEAVDMICRHAWDIDADLIVMTSHGRTGLSRAWLGSVADGVLRYSTTPVLMLRPIDGKTRRDAAHHLFKRVLVPVDGSPLSAEVLAAATSLAKCSDARMSLLRVVQPVPMIIPDVAVPYAYTPPMPDDPATKRLADEASHQLAEVARQLHEESGVEIEARVVVEERVASAILDFVRAHDIDVVAMSTHGRGASRFLLGSVADKVLRGSGVSMLLYRPLRVQERAPAEEASGDEHASALNHA
jgi:nucleotide-binding universal stress UspA family protein